MELECKEYGWNEKLIGQILEKRVLRVEQMEERVLLRSERRKEEMNGVQSDRDVQPEEGKRKKRKKKPRIRLIPIWLRLIIIPILMAVFALLGAMLGYGVIGEGDPKDALKVETWTHIYDIIFEGTPEE